MRQSCLRNRLEKAKGASSIMEARANASIGQGTCLSSALES